MEQYKIGIVEDEFIIACDLRQALEEMEYTVPKPSKDHDSALAMLEKERPDLVILDIQLDGTRDGIDLAENIRKQYDIPLIFLTANSDAPTVERAKKVQPNAFLTKPFNKKDLLLSIEIAISNFYNQRGANIGQKNEDTYLMKDVLFIKDGQYFHKIKVDDIAYIACEGAYVTFHTEGKKLLIRGSITQYLEKIGSKKIFRVHRSYAVNLEKVDLINTSYLKIKEVEIPVSKNYREELLAQINIA